MFHWGDLVAERTEHYGGLVIGVDPVFEDMPNCFRERFDDYGDCLTAYVDFLIESSKQKVGFVKFQSAFFEVFGMPGLRALANGIKLAKGSGMGVILDAKRGDIGSTAAAYARAYLTPGDAGGLSGLEADCLTVNPFLGPDTLEPFVDCSRRFGKGLFILTKTSNPGSGWLQDKHIDGEPVSDRIARLINGWAEETLGASGLGAVGAVVGATFPADGRNSAP